MDWLEFFKSLMPQLHRILHFLDSWIHRRASNRELDFVYSNINSTDMNSISDADAVQLLKGLAGVNKN